MVAYVIYSLIITCFLYPSITTWVWYGGWLQQKGFHDFAGCIIFMIGGLSSLWGAVFLGERYGKDRRRKQRMILRGGEPDEVFYWLDRGFEVSEKHMNEVIEKNDSTNIHTALRAVIEK